MTTSLDLSSLHADLSIKELIFLSASILKSSSTSTPSSSTPGNLTSGTSTSRLDASILLQYVTNYSKIELITLEDNKLSNKDFVNFTNLLEKRVQGFPIAHLIGKREFYSYDFKVTKDTLIPRPDTEILVEACIELIQKNNLTTVLDLGTGSGIIAITLAKECKNIQVIACDQSEKALNIAKQNAEKLHCSNICFIHSNWFSNINPKSHFDLIVSNPPYIDKEDHHLQQGDVRFEPISALVANNKGLADIEHIITCAKTYLTPNGFIAFEHGYNQKDDVHHLFQEHDYNNINHIQDYGGNHRVSYARHDID